MCKLSWEKAMKTKIYNWIPTCLDFRDLIDDDHSHLTAMLIMLQNRNEQSTKYFIFVWFWEMLDNIVRWEWHFATPEWSLVLMAPGSTVTSCCFWLRRIINQTFLPKTWPCFRVLMTYNFIQLTIPSVSTLMLLHF